MSDLYTFSLTPAQIKRFEDWKVKFATINIDYTFMFTPTHLGFNFVKVRVNVGRDESGEPIEYILDLTDYNDF